MPNEVTLTVKFSEDGAGAVITAINGVSQAQEHSRKTSEKAADGWGRNRGDVSQLSGALQIGRRDMNEMTSAISMAAMSSGKLSGAHMSLLRVFQETAEQITEVANAGKMAAGAFAGMIAGGAITLGIQAIAFTVDYLAKKNREAAETARKAAEEQRKYADAFRTDYQNTARLLGEIRDQATQKEDVERKATEALSRQLGGLQAFYRYYYDNASNRIQIEKALQDIARQGRALTASEREAVKALAEDYKGLNTAKTGGQAEFDKLLQKYIEHQERLYQVKTKALADHRRLEGDFWASRMTDLQQGYMEEFNKIEKYHNAGLMSEERYQQALLILKDKYSKLESARDKSRKEEKYQMSKTMNDILTAGSVAAAQAEKAGVLSHDAAVRVQAGIDAIQYGYKAVAAFATGNFISGALYTAAAAMAGKIAIQGAPNVDNTATPAQAPSGGIPYPTSQPATQGAPAPVQNIYIYGSIWARDQIARELAPHFKNAVQDRVDFGLAPAR